MKKIPYVIVKIMTMMLLLSFLSCTAIQKNTHISEEDNKALAELNIKLGLYYLIENKDVITAKEKLLKATKQAPENPMLWYTRAYFEEQTGDIAVARQYYEYALRMSPDDPAAQNNYAAFLCRQGEYQKAIDYFLRAAKNPDYVNTEKAYENATRCAKVWERGRPARTSSVTLHTLSQLPHQNSPKSLHSSSHSVPEEKEYTYPRA